jgi:hypothetical protein
MLAFEWHPRERLSTTFTHRFCYRAVKTILNQVQRFVGFVYQQVRMRGGPGKPELIEIMVEPQAGIRGRCSRCRQPAPGYDRLPQRRWLFVPLWGIPTYFC